MEAWMVADCHAPVIKNHEATHSNRKEQKTHEAHNPSLKECTISNHMVRAHVYLNGLANSDLFSL